MNFPFKKHLIYFVLFPILAYAGGWVGKKNFNPNDLGTVWTLQSDCENQNKDGCFEIPDDYNPAYYKTTYKAKTNVDPCTSEDDCRAKMSTPCPDETKHRVIGAEFKETYCTKALRLNEMPTKKVNWEKKQRQARAAEIQTLKTKQHQTHPTPVSYTHLTLPTTPYV